MYSPAFIEVNNFYVSLKAHILIEVIEFPGKTKAGWSEYFFLEFKYYSFQGNA